MTNQEFNKKLSNIISKYSTNILDELKSIWNNLKIDLSEKEKYEVLVGLIARQITIAKQFLSCSSIWTGDIAPIILRSMADNYINFAWIIYDPLERSRKFILYGLGQEKLIIEHRKNELIKTGLDPSKDELIKYSESWLNAQRYSFLTEVNVGSWSGITTREMAEQSDCIDFYNYVYLPFSCATHNTWNHISKYNLIYSDNPMHKNLLKPFIPDDSGAIDFIELASKYVDKMLKMFDSVFTDTPKRKSSYELLLESLSKLSHEINNGSA